jgi:hypothetical protein
MLIFEATRRTATGMLIGLDHTSRVGFSIKATYGSLPMALGLWGSVVSWCGGRMGRPWEHITLR